MQPLHIGVFLILFTLLLVVASLVVCPLSVRRIVASNEESLVEERILPETQILFSLFLTVALGYLVGEINLKGFSLGSGAVLFVGLAVGGFAPKAAEVLKTI